MGHEVDNRDTLSKYAESCSQCGECRLACDLLKDRNFTIGEIAESVAGGNLSESVCDIVRLCDVCGYCTRACPAELESGAVVKAARKYFVAHGRLPLDGLETMYVDHDWNAFSLYRNTYNVSYKDLELEHHDTLFFPGCSFSTFAPEITRAAYSWLKAQGFNVGLTMLCCGKPLESLGLEHRSNSLQRVLKSQLDAAGAGRVVTVCPSCHQVLEEALKGIEIISIYQLMRDAGVRLRGADALTIHDSCSDRKKLETARYLRTILGGHPLVEMEHSGSDTICCGAGGIVPAIASELCGTRTRRRVAEFEKTGAVRMVTACMACSRRLSDVAQDGRVCHALEPIFGIELDYEEVNRNREAMWQGEVGERNIALLANAKRITQEDENE